MNYFKVLLFFITTISYSITYAAEQICDIHEISRVEALEKISPQDLFPHINKTFTAGPSSVTYRRKKNPHYIIKLPTRTLYKNVVAVHPGTALFATEAESIGDARALIIGSLLEGLCQKQIPHSMDVPFEDLKFSPDGKKIIGITKDKIHIFILSQGLSFNLSSKILITCFALNNERLALGVANNTISTFFIPHKAELEGFVDVNSGGHPVKQICFGPDSEIVALNSYDAIKVHLKTDKRWHVAFEKKWPIFDHVQQIYSTGDPDSYIFITKDKKAGTQFFSYRLGHQ